MYQQEAKNFRVNNLRVCSKPLTKACNESTTQDYLLRKNRTLATGDDDELFLRTN